MAKYVGFKTGKIHEEYTYSDYYCGGCGYPVTDHDSYCPECGGAFRKCDSDEYNPCKLLAWIWKHPWINVSFHQILDKNSILVIVSKKGFTISRSIDMQTMQFFLDEEGLINILDDMYNEINEPKPRKTECIVTSGDLKFNWTIYNNS